MTLSFVRLRASVWGGNTRNVELAHNSHSVERPEVGNRLAFRKRATPPFD